MVINKKGLLLKQLSTSLLAVMLTTTIVGISLPAMSEAATYTVTKTTDDNGSCDSTDCSFREAVLAANANPGADTIDFSTSTAGTPHTISITSGSVVGEYNNFYVSEEITIAGLGVKATIIDGASLANVFYVNSTGTVTFEDLTIRNGYSTEGAGIYSKSDVILDTVVLRDNYAYSCSSYYSCGGAGGALKIYEATLTVSDSDFISNNSDNHGGGIYAYDSNVSINNANFRGNSGVGGAIYQEDSNSLKIDGSTFIQNTSRSHGGAIISGAAVTITDSSFLENEASYTGGALYTGNGDQYISNSTFLHNSAGSSAGAIRIGSANAEIDNVLMKSNSSAKYGGALAVSNQGSSQTLVIKKTIISENSTSSGSSTYSFGGGGIAFTQLDGEVQIIESTIRNNDSAQLGGGISAIGATNGTIDIQSSTISGNNAIENGGGIWTDSDIDLSLTRSTISGNASDDNGGGIYAENDTYIAATTIAYNTADNDGDGVGEGGGIYANSAATAYLKNSLLQLNTNTAAPDCSGVIQSDDYNVIGSTTGCSYTSDTHDTTGRTQSISALARNGGPTMTHAFSAPIGSVMSGPAFNKIPLTSCTDYSGRVLKRDQRGMSRHGQCDIGSYEY